VVKSSGCSFAPAPGVSGNITISAIPGNRSSGSDSAWVFAFRNGAGDLALASVVGGRGLVLGSLSGSTCASAFGLLSALPSSVIDSSQAASAVAPFASAFLAAHPNATALDTIIGGFSFLGLAIGPEWSIEYSTCAPTTATGTMGAVFNATVDAVNGTVISSHTTTSVVCSSGTKSSPPTTPLASVFDVEPRSIYSNGMVYLYNLSVVIAGSGVTWFNATPEILDSGGNPIGTGTSWSLAVTNGMGSAIAWYNSTTLSWTGAADQPISTSEAISITASANLDGDILEFHGVGAFSGTLASSV
jgi:hypothetical protein